MIQPLQKNKNIGLLFLICLLALISIRASISQASTIQEPNNPSGALDLSVQPFATGLSSPVGLVNAGDDRLFAIEQAGRIKIIQNDGTVLATPFLNIATRVASGGEMGLLGIAFHPDYANNGYFYLQYTSNSGGRHTRISRFSVSTGNPNIADQNSENILLTIPQPYSNHNSGGIYFSPNDGYLYIPMGDGGSGGDPQNYSQTLTTLLGKIIRIDVDESGGSAPDCLGNFPGETGDYTVPADNPFTAVGDGTCNEIWGIGLRNPWRGSFDRQTGDLWLGDVGQNAWEEIDFQPANSTGGENYGWRCYEGNSTYNTSGCGPMNDYVFPVHTMPNGPNCSAVGGYVYRGSQYPNMIGHYLASDFCTGYIWDITPNGQGGWSVQQYTNVLSSGPSSFGEDVNGELYAVSLGGTVYHIQENSVDPVPGVTLSNENQSASGNPNTVVTYNHLLTNTGNTQDTFTVDVDSTQGWAATPNPVTLAAGANTMLTIQVSIPAGALAGVEDVTTVTVSSGIDDQVAASAEDTTTVNQVAGVSLASGGQNTFAAPDSVVTFSHLLTNNGNANDTFIMSAMSAQGWDVSVNGNPTVAPGGTVMIEVTVEVPASASNKEIDTVTLIATSNNNNNTTAQVSDSITVIENIVNYYFPIVIRQKKSIWSKADGE